MDTVSNNRWPLSEERAFERALANFPEDAPDRWEKIAAHVPGRSPAEIQKHYEDFMYDKELVETGLYELPNCTENLVQEPVKEDSCSQKITIGTIPNLSKKRVLWTEEEHRLFLLGLQKYEKGDWKNISRYFVKSKTPTQIASHAQKYYLRQQNDVPKKRKRASIHDIPLRNSDLAVLQQNHVPPLIPMKQQLSSQQNQVPPLIPMQQQLSSQQNGVHHLNGPQQLSSQQIHIPPLIPIQQQLSSQQNGVHHLNGPQQLSSQQLIPMQQQLSSQQNGVPHLNGPQQLSSQQNHVPPLIPMQQQLLSPHLRNGPQQLYPQQNHKVPPLMIPMQNFLSPQQNRVPHLWNGPQQLCSQQNHVPQLNGPQLSLPQQNWVPPLDDVFMQQSLSQETQQTLGDTSILAPQQDWNPPPNPMQQLEERPQVIHQRGGFVQSHYAFQTNLDPLNNVIHQMGGFVHFNNDF